MVFQNPEQQLTYTIAKDDIGMALENLGYSKRSVRNGFRSHWTDGHRRSYRGSTGAIFELRPKEKVAIAGCWLSNHVFYCWVSRLLDWILKGGTKWPWLWKTSSNGINIIVTSHDMDLMYDCCDYAYLIKGQDYDPRNKIWSIPGRKIVVRCWTFCAMDCPNFIRAIQTPLLKMKNSIWAVERRISMAKSLMIQEQLQMLVKKLNCCGLVSYFKTRWLHGCSFKSQNMALNSFITKRIWDRKLRSYKQKPQVMIQMFAWILSYWNQLRIVNPKLFYGQSHKDMDAVDYQNLSRSYC